MTQRELQKEQTRNKIYTTAIRLFAENGFHKTKISDIVKDAGVSVGSFYNYFPTKESIIDEGYRFFDEDLEKFWQSEKPEPGLQTIRYLLNVQVGYVVEVGVDWTSVFFKNQLGIEHHYYFANSRFLYTKLKENTLFICPDEAQAENHVQAFLRIIRGTIYDWCLHDGQYDVAKTAMEAVEIYLEHHHLK